MYCDLSQSFFFPYTNTPKPADSEDIKPSLESLRESLRIEPGQMLDPKRLRAMMDQKREHNDAPVNDDPGMVAILLESGADVKVADRSGNTALMKAARAGNVNSARLLLEHGADTRATDSTESTPLMLAAEQRRLETVRLLLENGADSDYRTPQGRTALMSAAQGGRIQIADLLLTRGQYVDATDVNGVTALQLAAFNDHTEMVAFLRERGAQIGFLEAIAMGDIGLAMQLPVPEIAARPSRWGEAALFTATRKGRADLIRLLLKHGVDPNAASNYGKPVLMQAVIRGNVECARLLLDAGARVEATRLKLEAVANPDMPGLSMSPLKWAASHGDMEMLDLLLAYGANIGTTTEAEDPPLGGAVMRGHLEMARRLLELGADPNQKTMNTPPLTFAVTCKNQEMVRLLLDYGANPRANHTPMFAHRTALPEIAEMLQKAAGTDRTMPI